MLMKLIVVNIFAGIRKEIQDIEDGKMDMEINPLKMAPHTQEQIINSNWDRPYARELGAFPMVKINYNSINDLYQ